MTAPTLHPGDTWTPTRPGSRAKARTIAWVEPVHGMWVHTSSAGTITTLHRSHVWWWIARHAAVRTRAGDVT